MLSSDSRNSNEHPQTRKCIYHLTVERTASAHAHLPNPRLASIALTRRKSQPSKVHHASPPPSEVALTHPSRPSPTRSHPTSDIVHHSPTYLPTYRTVCTAPHRTAPHRLAIPPHLTQSSPPPYLGTVVPAPYLT
ncbi:hypothetical protein PMIN07_005208 [Paraphaeosphaeria minitans]